MFDFRGKVALVTGAGSGIGKATAGYFLQCGASVVMADIRFDALDAGVGEFGAPERTRKITYDASNPTDADAAVRLCVESFGGLDYPGWAGYDTKNLLAMVRQADNLKCDRMA